LSHDDKIAFGKQIRERMESEKLYLDPLLTLDSMARLLGISSKYLSQTINECFSMNFSDFINSFRVKEFIRLLKQDTRNQTILNISIDAGFNSKSAFNQAFKKHTGSSPSNYLKKVTQKRIVCATDVYADSIYPVPSRDVSTS
jgi:AraC-like DNA-binding protein